MKKVLFITYVFPPCGGTSVQRSSKFTKYLKDYGYDPIVLTTNAEEKKKLRYAYTVHHMDQSLLDDLKRVNLKIVRTRSFEPNWFFNILNKLKLNRLKRFLFIPDVAIFWIIPALRAGTKIIRENKIELIYTSAPPQSINITGLILSRICKLPWLADFRDPWTQNAMSYYATPLHYRIHKKLAKIVYQKATKIVVCTPRSKQDLLKTNKQIPPSKISVITHGYDAEDFYQKSKLDRNEKFTISYIGVFYREYKDASGRKMNLKNMLSKMLYYKVFPLDYNSATPYYLLKAINQLLNIYPNMKKQIAIRFIGPLSSKNEMLINEFSLQDITEITGYIEHNKCIKMMRESDILVYIIGYSNQPLYWIKGKLFEYMASKIPILALIPEGDSKDFLESSGLAFFAHPKNIEEIAEKIYSLYQQWGKDGITVHPNAGFISQFERKKLTCKLADIFNQVLEG